MIPLHLLIVLSLLRSSCSHQYYDRTPCSSVNSDGGGRYACNSTGDSCRTFVVYRAQNEFSTIAAISDLFRIDSDVLLSINSNVSSPMQVLDPEREVLVPIKCSCFSDRFYRSNFTYASPQNAAVSEIACGVYEGLVKSVTLIEENQVVGNLILAGSTLIVPLNCACLDQIERSNGLKYLITYPLIEHDSTPKVGSKFNVSVEEIWEFNGLDPFAPTVFPTTTILVPVRDEPSINFSIPETDPPTPQFLPTKPVQRRPKTSQIMKVYIAGSVVGFCLLLALLISCALYLKALKKFKDHRIKASTLLNSCSSPFSGPPTRSSTTSCLSPDFLVGIKYSLSSYSVGEIKIAMKNFEDGKISGSMHKGLIKNDEVLIEEMRYEGTQHLIDLHSRINHVNIMRLRGVCYGDHSCSCSCSCSCSYLVFESPTNGSLRDCLRSSSAALHWHRRTQIAFDIATGLHYLHYSAYTHLSLNITRVFLTGSWRAKIAVCGGSLTSPIGWMAPEKVEILEFGLLLLEIISGKEEVDGKVERESMSFLGGNEGGCFDHLRNFVDPSLKDDYPLAEALCLAVLAGSCVEDDPMHRPSMEDVLKILARMV